MPEFSPDDGIVTRFAFEGRKHRANGELLWRAFLTELYEGRYELSTFWIVGLSTAEIWELAENKTPKARADFPASTCAELNLRAELDAIIPRHVFVLNWPIEKELRKSKAQQFAALVAE